MKNRSRYYAISLLLIITAILCGCTKYGFVPDPNNLLKQVKVDGIVVDQYSYYRNNLIEEVNGRLFYRKYHYDDNNKLIKEEVAISPDSYSSSMPAGLPHEFVDPEKTGISMYMIYEYDMKGKLARQLNYIPENGQFVFRSMRTYEYNDNNLISKVLLHNSDSTVTQLNTYQYDNNGNVVEEDYLTFLFTPAGTGPKLLIRTNYEYDTYFNPFAIFRQSANPGIFTNPNNIIKTRTHNYVITPGVDNYSESEIFYEYDYETGFPVKVKNGEEYIY